MKVSTKLYLTVGILALIGMTVAGSGIWYLRTLGRELGVATGKTAVKLDLVNATRARAWEMVAALRGTFVFASLKNQTEFDSNVQRWQAAFKRTREQIAELRPLMDTDEGRRELERFESGVGEFESTSAAYIRFCGENQIEQVAGLTPKIQDFASLAEDALNHLKDQQRKLLKESQATSDSLRSASLWISLVLTGALLMVVLLSVFVVRGISRTLVIAAAELFKGAEQVAAQVSSASQSLAQGFSEQAASLQETSASTEEINAMARRNGENSGSAAGLMARSQQNFVQANQSLDEMVQAMEDINGQSEKISKIIRVIDEIAFQTNILALNAAVEAARAGESGMGFAVVANEVRNLAQRCAQAARDTTALIEESIAKSAGAKLKVDHVANAIRTITGESGHVKMLVEEVSVGSREQARGIEQISLAINQMEQVTQTTAAGAEESASAAEELNAQSEALKSIVTKLRALVGGEETSTAAPVTW